jgi:serine/threonine-protein kinase
MAEGQLLNKRYTLQRRIGFGGMGAVYTAHDRIMDRAVAVKELREEYAADELLRRRFVREAQAAGGLNHPNIVTVHDLIDEDGTLFIVMEYLDGGTLLDRMNAAPDRRMDVDELLSIGRDALRGLEAAHEKELVHRDIKPGNLLFDRKGTVKIADFGVVAARGRYDDATALTQAGTHPGTLVYMAPEQIDGAEVDGRSDVYSMAAVLYEALAGIRYFERAGVRRSERALMDAICELPPVPLRLHVPYVPESVERVIGAALVKDIDERPTAGELASRLEGLLRSPRPKPQIVVPGGAGGGGAPSAAELEETLPAGSSRMSALDDLITEVRPRAGTSPGPTVQPPTLPSPQGADPLATTPVPSIAPATTRAETSPTTPARRTVRPVITGPAVVGGTPPSGRPGRAGLEVRARDGAAAVRLPAGTFVLGSEASSDEMPPRQVHVGEVVIDRDPVTVGAYRRFLEAVEREGPPDVLLLHEVYPHGKDHRPQGWGTREFEELCPTDEHPVVLVDWFDAMAYAAWAGARLPTEAEWERGARGTLDVRRHPWGDEPPSPSRAVFGRRSQGPLPVGGRDAGDTLEGLRDMVGNVWEWCLDRYDARAYATLPAEDPLREVDGPGARAVKRGGSWTNGPTSLRCSKRGYEKLHARRANLGFRCARSD